ncbi:hypothetical protein BC828DRAFT_377334 [Blastocladiella britannica]|nr:hypothetical protein BC828DRAFT_377334 [Blastocladiella britannica]
MMPLSAPRPRPAPLLMHAAAVPTTAIATSTVGETGGGRPEIELRDVDAATLPALQALNLALFPIAYNQRYYEQVLVHRRFASAAYVLHRPPLVPPLIPGVTTPRWDSLPSSPARTSLPGGPPPSITPPQTVTPPPSSLVGAITCRKEPLCAPPGGTLWPSHEQMLEDPACAYRLYIMTLGVILPFRRLGLASAMATEILSRARADLMCTQVVLHVHTASTGAFNLYMALGFQCVQTVSDYYHGLVPPSAYYLVHDLGRTHTPSLSPSLVSSAAATTSTTAPTERNQLSDSYCSDIEIEDDDWIADEVSYPPSETDI